MLSTHADLLVKHNSSMVVERVDRRRVLTKARSAVVLRFDTAKDLHNRNLSCLFILFIFFFFEVGGGGGGGFHLPPFVLKHPPLLSFRVLAMFLNLYAASWIFKSTIVLYRRFLRAFSEVKTYQIRYLFISLVSNTN